jgi:hypothetical protein
MKPNFTRITMGLFFLATLVGAATMARAHSCSTQEAAGDYGFTLTGVILTSSGSIPAAAVGRATVNVSGHVTGSEARSVAGGYADETFTGTLSVNSDCTGSMTLNFYEAGLLARTSVLSVVFVDNQRELRMLQKSFTLPNGASVPVVITAEAKRIFTDQLD